MKKVPQILTDPEELAKTIWNYWTSVLKTDGVAADECASWEELDNPYKEDFIEALRVNISDPIRRMVEEEKLDEALEQSFVPEQSNMNNGSYPCYTCGVNPTSQSGSCCGECRYRYRKSHD